MICYLEQTLAAHSLLADGYHPDWLLHPLESRRFRRFRLLKRRKDWLLGRWTAKHLIQSYLDSVSGDHIALSELLIGSDADGAPYAALLPHKSEKRPADQEKQTFHRLPLSLSISHSGDRALCAVCPESFGVIGADTERIEIRDPSFVETFFTEPEMDLIASLDAPERDIITTGIWSAKEAVLKSLRTGLRTDTRQVQCLPRFLDDIELNWSPVQVVLGQALISTLPSDSRGLGWWRFHGGYVKTLALMTHKQSSLPEIRQLQPIPQPRLPDSRFTLPHMTESI